MTGVRVETRGGVRLVRLERPERLNALDRATSAACRDVFAEAARDDDIRVVIVTGSGDRAFCAGSDLKAAHEAGSERADVSIGGITKDVALFKPVIAAINGLAFGGGLEIVLACDLRIAVPTATFAAPEVKVGLIAGGGGVVRLADNLPWAIASEMLLRARVLTADEALRFGLINAVVEPDELLSTAWRWAAEMAAFGPLALRTSKEAMWRTRGTDLFTALEVEERYSDIVKLSADAKEGIDAFVEKRPARFEGR